MNAKEGSARPAALGRGLDTLMGNEEERDAPSAAGISEERPCGHGACLVGGLIASGAAGALAVAAFTLLGVRAVLAMGR
ncbi:hypothetical protein [Eggerthella timonensis]|uniref:hypothetical protein n=1 Tax=Eggerthella timonensis TaxID=1871008 RepID=UPI000C77DFB4|nr:hypothetical protein [Eggerthella timonensis]